MPSTNKHKALRDFVRGKVKDTKTEGDQARKRKDMWIASLQNLHSMIREWLGDADSGEVSYHITTQELSEDLIGPYEVEILHIFIGKQKVSLYPKGTYIVGGNGRVDLWGQKSIKLLILNDKWKWELVKQKTPTIKTELFTEASFLEALKEIMD